MKRDDAPVSLPVIADALACGHRQRERPRNPTDILLGRGRLPVAV
jgi:hypothetical protein